MGGGRKGGQRDRTRDGAEGQKEAEIQKMWQ